MTEGWNLRSTVTWKWNGPTSRIRDGAGALLSLFLFLNWRHRGECNAMQQWVELDLCFFTIWCLPFVSNEGHQTNHTSKALDEIYHSRHSTSKISQSTPPEIPTAAMRDPCTPGSRLGQAMKQVENVKIPSQHLNTLNHPYLPIYSLYKGEKTRWRYKIASFSSIHLHPLLPKLKNALLPKAPRPPSKIFVAPKILLETMPDIPFQVEILQ